jgi:hypothetical protein
MSEWDPIGVKDIPEAADEYDGYLGDIFELIEGDAPPSEIAEYLRSVESQSMCLPETPNSFRLSVAESLKRVISTL